MAKQIKVTYQTDSLLILRGGYSQRAFCSACGTEADVLALEQAELVSNLTQSALEQWLASDELHRFEAADGSTLICFNSLLSKLQGHSPQAQP